MSSKEPLKSNSSQHPGLRPVPKNLPILDQTDLAILPLQRAHHSPHTLTPRDIHQLQRTLGNRATSRLITKTSPPAPLIQRVIPNNLNGADEEEMYQQRKQGDDFTPGRNKGWIKILIPPAVAPITVFAQSEFGEHHTEEKLVDLAVNTYNVNLATAPNAPPLAGSRIISLYTEREPCNGNNADNARQGRNQGNCQAYLQQTLHAGVQVSFSVPNRNDDHRTLLGRQKLRSIVEGEIAGLQRYAQSTYTREYKKRFGYPPSLESYQQCRQYGLDKLLQIASQILWRNVTPNGVANFVETEEAISNEAVEAQFKIDEHIESYVKETILAPETPPSSPQQINY